MQPGLLDVPCSKSYCAWQNNKWQKTAAFYVTFWGGCGEKERQENVFLYEVLPLPPAGGSTSHCGD